MLIFVGCQVLAFADAADVVRHSFVVCEGFIDLGLILRDEHVIDLTAPLEEVVDDVDDAESVWPSDFIFDLSEKKGWEGILDLRFDDHLHRLASFVDKKGFVVSGFAS